MNVRTHTKRHTTHEIIYTETKTNRTGADQNPLPPIASPDRQRQGNCKETSDSLRELD